MGIIQNLAQITMAGKVTVQAEIDQGDNISPVWFKVTLEIDGHPFIGYDPELNRAIFTVKRMMEDHNSRMNMARLGEILAHNPVKISDKKG